MLNTIIDADTIIKSCPVCPSRNQHGDCNLIEFLPLLAKDFATQEQYTRLVKVGHSRLFTNCTRHDAFNVS